MERRLDIYLRTYRRRWSLTQQELAALLGIQSGTHVSRLERGLRQPTLPTVISCSLIFGVDADELFPALVTSVRDETTRRAYELFLDLQGNPSRSNKVKLDLLEDALSRATSKSKRTRV